MDAEIKTLTEETRGGHFTSWNVLSDDPVNLLYALISVLRGWEHIDVSILISRAWELILRQYFRFARLRTYLPSIFLFCEPEKLFYVNIPISRAWELVNISVLRAWKLILRQYFHFASLRTYFSSIFPFREPDNLWERRPTGGEYSRSLSRAFQ